MMRHWRITKAVKLVFTPITFWLEMQKVVLESVK